MSVPQVILLNGISSSGKSSLAKALQQTLDAPYLHVCIDTFEEMAPGRKESGGEFASHSVFNKMLSGFHHSLAALASRGNDLIVDTVIVEDEEPADWLTECLGLLEPFGVCFVGLRCPLEELERREKARGDRPAGLARWQFPRMHQRVVYDVEVDTSSDTPQACAAQVIAVVSKPPFDGVAATLRLNT